MSEKDTSHDDWTQEPEQKSSKTIDLAEWLRKNHAYLEKRAKEKAERQNSTPLISETDNEAESDSSEAVDNHLQSDEATLLTEETIDGETTIDNDELAQSTEESFGDGEDSEASQLESDSAEQDDSSETSEDHQEGPSEEDGEDFEEASEDSEDDSLEPTGEELVEDEDAARPEASKDKWSRRTLVFTPKQKQMLRLATLFLLTISVIVIAGYFVSPLSKLKHILVEGQSQVSQEDVLANTGIDQTDYTLTTVLKQKQIEQSIEKELVWVKDAQVSYQFPVDFKIVLEEHRVIGYVKDGGTYYPVLSSGDVLDSAVAVENLPSPFLSFDLTDLKSVKTFVRKVSQLEEASPLSRLLSVKLTPTNATEDLLTIETVEGHTILVPLSEIAEKLPYYEKIIKDLHVPSYIDMEAGIFTYAK